MLRDLVELAGDSTPTSGVGPGDDAAGWRAAPGGLVLWSTDTLCEEVDFRRRYQTPYQLGWKAWMAALSDLSAMGAIPRGGLVAASIPADTGTRALHAIQLGLVEAAAGDDAVVMGGDLGRTDGPLTLTVTVMGEVLDGSPLLLSGGGPGDCIVVTGALGMAAAALECLERGAQPVPKNWQDKLLMPSSRVTAGSALRRGGASALTDLSDGLLLGLSRLCQASGVGAELWLDRLPVGHGLEATGRAVELALTGGEDFELLATIPQALAGGLLRGWDPGLPRLTVLGRLTAGEGTQLFRAQGGEPVENRSGEGYRHF
ncbi:MAG: thiamine-phosphate kinase [Candidatus Dormibacteria bacterium]